MKQTRSKVWVRSAFRILSIKLRSLNIVPIIEQQFKKIMPHQKWFILHFFFVFARVASCIFYNAGSFDQLIQMHSKQLPAKDGKQLCSSKDTFNLTLCGEVWCQWPFHFPRGFVSHFYGKNMTGLDTLLQELTKMCVLRMNINSSGRQIRPWRLFNRTQKIASKLLLAQRAVFYHKMGLVWFKKKKQKQHTLS